MKAALHAEWTKLRTVIAPSWLLLGTIVATVALSAGAASLMPCRTADCDTTKLSLLGVQLGQAPVAILAVLVISGEYSSGMIRTTLAATPRRAIAFAAKAINLGAVVAAAATLSVLGSLLAGQFILSRDDVAATPGTTDWPILRATAGSILYLVLIALLALGIAAVVRSSAIGVGIVLGLLYLLPILAQAIGDPEWNRLLQRIGPMSAGLAVQTTTDLDSLPLGPWAGLGVTAGWATAALVAGGLAIRLRDV